MKILEVNLPNFKNLHDFTIKFDDERNIAVLVGRNGTGKSNLLEALTIIFRDLDLGQPTTFAYRIKYECGGDLIELVNSSRQRLTDCTVNGQPISAASVQGPTGAHIRPRHVFGYYSGPSNRLEEHFRPHQERFYRALVRGHESPLRPLFYARNVHSNFVLLAFFLERDLTVQRLLAEQLGIEGLDSVLFVMQKPEWGQRSRTAQGDARFWNARGTVRTLLDRLYRLSLAPMRRTISVPVGLGRHRQVEQLFLFLPDLEAARDLADNYPNSREFFKALESTYISELIADVRIRVRVHRSEFPLTFRELSEGEQQLLLVLGLMRFTREDESLFLLDEPDTHLNPAWSVQYRRFLEVFGALDAKSHVVMATHDPLVVAGLTRSEVRIFERSRDSSVRASPPVDDPQGMGVGALLTSDVYGLRSQLDLETLEKLDQKRNLAAKAHLTDEEAERLADLARELSTIGLLMEDRDPEFQEYLQQKYRHSPRARAHAEPDETSDLDASANEAIASEIFNEVMERDPASDGPSE